MVEPNGTPSTTPTPARTKSKIPATLRALDRWTTWELTKAHGGKPTKIPAGSTRDRSNLWAFEDVENTLVGPNGGVGFIFTNRVQVDDQWLIGFDLDACVDPETRELVDWAQEALAACDGSYAEFSPSGTGLRVFFLTDTEPDPVPVVKVPATAPDGVSKRPEIQTFGCGPAGYVTVTGDQVPGTADEPLLCGALQWLEDRYELDRIRRERTEELPKGEGPPPTFDEIRHGLEQVQRTAHLLHGEWEQVMPDRTASDAFFDLCRAALAAGRRHGDVVVDFLLEETPWGDGLIHNSKEPEKYGRRDWVEEDVARAAGKLDLQRSVDLLGEVTPEMVAEVDRRLDQRKQQLLERRERMLREGTGKLFTLAEMRAKAEHVTFVFNGFLPERGFVTVVGAPKSGKSTVAVSLAAHALLGEDWHGLECDKRGRVVYFCGEGHVGLHMRFSALLARLGGEDVATSGRFLMTDVAADLGDPKAADRWMEWIAIEGEIHGCRREPVAMIVVDTLFRNFGPRSENDDEAMRTFVDQVSELARRLGTVAVVIHHTKKGSASAFRGHSSLQGAADAEIVVTTKSNVTTAKLSLGKDIGGNPAVRGRLETVAMGEDDKGRPIETVVFTGEEAVFDEGSDEDVIAEVTEELATLVRVVATSEDGMASSGIQEAMGWPERSTRRKLGAALDEGLLQKVGAGRNTRYLPTDKGLALSGQTEWPDSMIDDFFD